jgi:hypothetical protein
MNKNTTNIPMTLTEKQTYWKQPENQQKAIEQLSQNEPAMMRLMIAVNNAPKGNSDGNS